MDFAKLHLHWRACKRGENEYRSYSLARAYRDNGKNRKEIVLKLGALSSSEVDQWRSALQVLKNPSGVIRSELNNLVIISNRAYLDVAVILEAWNSWGLNAVFDSLSSGSRREVPLSSLVVILVINRCLDPASKSKVCSWIKKTAFSFLLGISNKGINPARIYRELPSIEACKDQISQHLCKTILQDDPDSMKSLFYDLSSTTFTGPRCILTKWGHCKEGYEYHIVLALIVNTKGLPLYWEVLEGGTADATTITWLLNRLKEKLSTAIPIPTMVFDRGMVSDDNLSLLEEGKIKYISAMDKNQIESITKFDFSEFSKMTVENIDSKIKECSEFIKLDKDTYAKEACTIGKRRYVLCFNPQLFKDQKKAREEQIIKFGVFAKQLNEELLQAQMDRDKEITQKKFEAYLNKAKLNGFIKVELEEWWVKKKNTKTLKVARSYKSTVYIDEKKKLEDGKLDGFWLLVTTISEKTENGFEHDTLSVVRPYREKVIVESAFRDIKSFIEISPVHVWKADHVRAHYTICVLAHLIDRTLSLTLHERSKGKSSEIVSHERLYDELETCRLNHFTLEGIKQDFYKFTQPTALQLDLLQRLQMTHLISDNTLRNLTIS